MSSAAISQAFERLEGTLRNEADALVIAIHACLDTEGFRLIGVGEDVPKSGAKDLTSIPSKWNEADDVYTLSYRHQDAPGVFFFKLLVVDDVMIVHSASERNEDLHILELRLADYVQFAASYADAKEYSKMYTDCDQLLRSIKANITAKLLPRQTDKKPPLDCGAQAREASRAREDASRGGQMYPDVGRPDLMPGLVPSPFGVGPGGMLGGEVGNLVGPRNPGFGGWGGMGVGGARFDPIGPPGLGPLGPRGGFGPNIGGPNRPRFPPGFGGDPDNDVFRPPSGRGDDMFL